LIPTIWCWLELGRDLIGRELAAARLVVADGAPSPIEEIWPRADRQHWRRSSSRHQDLREGSASEALLLDDVELQVRIEIGEWAPALTDRNRDR
jgi:hypothetical protein